MGSTRRKLQRTRSLLPHFSTAPLPRAFLRVGGPGVARPPPTRRSPGLCFCQTRLHEAPQAQAFCRADDPGRSVTSHPAVLPPGEAPALSVHPELLFLGASPALRTPLPFKAGEAARALIPGPQDAPPAPSPVPVGVARSLLGPGTPQPLRGFWWEPAVQPELSPCGFSHQGRRAAARRHSRPSTPSPRSGRAGGSRLGPTSRT